MLACIAFDFDGALVHSNAFKRAAYGEIFSSFSDAADLIRNVLAADGHGDRHDVIRAILTELRKSRPEEARLRGEEAVERYVGMYGDRCERFTASCPEINGAGAVLPWLADRFPLYINSDTPEMSLRRVVDKRKWNGFFRMVFGRPRLKEENLRLICEREGISPANVLFVGDRQRDCDAAIKVGCRFIGMRSDENDFTSNVCPVKDLLELRAIISEEMTGRDNVDNRCR